MKQRCQIMNQYSQNIQKIISYLDLNSLIYQIQKFKIQMQKEVTPQPPMVHPTETTKGEDDPESKEPGKFEIFCMDIFLQYNQFNDGFLQKKEMNLFMEFLETNNQGFEKIRQKLKSKFDKFSDSDLVDFVTFAQLLSDSGYTAEILEGISYSIYDKKFGGRAARIFCSCFKKCLCFKFRIKGVTSYVNSIIQLEEDALAAMKKGEDDSDDEIDLKQLKKEAGDFFQSANKVYSNITELLDKGSDVYLLYKVYEKGMAIINNPQDNVDEEGNFKWNKWSYQIVIINMFISIASNFLISFSSYIYLLLYKGYYDPDNFKRLNCCQALGRFFILTFIGPLIFLFFQISEVIFTIMLFLLLFVGDDAVKKMRGFQWRFYELNFGLNIQEFDGFTLQQKIAQLFFSSLPTTITNILIINKVLDCAELVEESPKAIYLSLVMSVLNICSTLFQIYMESRGFEEAYLSYSMNCMNAKNGWIPFIHKIQSGNLNQSLNYYLMQCIQPQLTPKVCYYKQFSYQFSDQTIQSLAQDLNLWKQNMASGIFPKSNVKYWLRLGSSVENVSLIQLLQLLNGLGDDLIEISLQNIDWKRAINNAKYARHIIQEQGKKYEARTPSHMPCLQICIDGEGFQQDTKDQGANDNLEISIKHQDHSNTNVDYSDYGHDQAPEVLLDDSRRSKWCLNFDSGETYVNFEFDQVLELHYYMFTFANDCSGRDPVEWNVEFTTEDGKKVEFTHRAQTKKEPARFEKEKFPLKDTLFAKSAKFTFLKNRGNEGLLQINEIGFYVQNPECKKVELQIKNLIHLVSYQKELKKCFIELLNDGANPDIANNQGQSMLLYAILNKKPKSIDLLIKHGADINKPSPNGVSPIQAILENNDFGLFKKMLESKADLSKKLINNEKVSPKQISTIHFIAKRTRIDEQQGRDGELFSLLKGYNIKFPSDGEVRQHVFRQAFRCFRFDYYPNGNKFNRVFPKLLSLIPNLKLSEQRDTKGNNFMHIIFKGFSKEVGSKYEGYVLETVASLNYVHKNLPELIENETKFTVDSLQEYLCSQGNNVGQLPIEIAMEKENTFGVLYALKFTKKESITEQKETVILEWLYKQGGRDLVKAEKEMQKKLGEENRYDVTARWDDLREGLSALISDKEKLEKFFLDKANKTGNWLILYNMKIEYDESKFEIKEEAGNKDEDVLQTKKDELKEIQTLANEKLQEMVRIKFVKSRGGNENWMVILFIFILELSATFDLAGDLFMLWAMLQEDTAWATLTIYCMITPYFVSYAPLVNYQIENWRVNKQEGLDVTGRMKALAWVTLTPCIIIYIFLMDLVFLLISSVLTPIFFLIHFFSCGKFNFTRMLDSTDVIYEKVFDMKRLDVNGFRRLRTISQLVFESFPQIILQCYILWYSLQPKVIEELNGEKLLGIDQYYIYGSVIFAIFHMCMEAILLFAEAKACRTSFIHYLLICLNGRLGWVPFTNILQDQDAAKITQDEVLDFDDINAKTLCGKYSLEYEFGDKTASTLSKEIMLLQQSPNKKERPSLKIGESLNRVTFSTFLNLLFFSHRRVNLNIDDVDFESMLLKSQKYLNEINQAKQDGFGGQFLLSLVELGHLSLVQCIVDVCKLQLGSVKDGEKLVGMAMRNKDMKMAKFLLSTGIKINPNPIEGSPNVPEGYRHVYIDELFEDQVLLRAFKQKIPTWGIIAVMNGWTEGAGYGSKKVKDMNERSKNGGITWMYVTEAYPICPAVQKIYELE